MGSAARNIHDVEDWVQQDVEAAVRAGEGDSVDDLAAQILTQWALSRRAESPEFIAFARKAIEESRADDHPGYPIEDVFAELRARYAEPASET